MQQGNLWRASFAWVLTTFIALWSAPSWSCANARVVGITDGDTISTLCGGLETKIRLAGIDSPEERQPYGKRAKSFTADLAYGQYVAIVEKDKDRYGRIVADVILPDGRNLNQELVRTGLAWWYARYAPEDETLKALEAEARAARRGLWADSEPVAPWEWRQR